MRDDIEQLTEAARQLATLKRIARITARDMALRPMLQHIVDTLFDEFSWEFVACASVDMARGEFICEAMRSAVDTSVMIGYRRALGSGVVGECALTQKTIDIPDARTHPNFVDTLGGTLSELCVPVIHNGELMAVLNAESRRLDAFRGQRDMLETVAGQVAGMLHAANLLEELQRANAQLQQAYRELESASQRDVLTGVANRRRFDQWLNEATHAAAQSGRPLALLLIDVDNFKAYNDGYGHVAGDACLRLIASVLAAVVEDTPARLARYGGEEFALVFPDADMTQATALAERLRLAVAARALEHRHAASGHVTVSIGVATAAPCQTVMTGLLVERADTALYEAKRSGRNQVRQAAASRETAT